MLCWLIHPLYKRCSEGITLELPFFLRCVPNDTSLWGGFSLSDLVSHGKNEAHS